jgi:hypothetical protein
VDCEPCDRDELRAYWAGDYVLIAARGTLPESCWEVRLERSPLTIWPPEFNLNRCKVSDVCLEMLTPYAITETFAMGTNPGTVTVHFAGGTEDVSVEPIPTMAQGALDRQVGDVSAETEIRVTASSLVSFQDAVDAAFRKIASDGPEGLASARVERQWVSRGGFVGVNQYHVELVHLPFKRS